MVGFIRNGSMNIYTHSDRVLLPERAPEPARNPVLSTS
jgi:hypothetical protein